MRHRENLVGRRIGRLVVIRAAEDATFPGGGIMGRWECNCDCGNTKIIHGGHLRQKMTLSCGCIRKEKARDRMTTHGESRSGLCQGRARGSGAYGSWLAMITRCTNVNQGSAHNYVLRGISVCDRWLSSFANFKSDMGPRPKGMCIERIDNNGNYEPGNCRWATMKEQANNSRNNRFLVKDGIRLTVSRWAERLKINPMIIYSRLHQGTNPFRPITRKCRNTQTKI